MQYSDVSVMYMLFMYIHGMKIKRVALWIEIDLRGRIRFSISLNSFKLFRRHRWPGSTLDPGLLLSSNGYTQSFTTFPCSKQAVKGINKHDRIISDIISICIVLPSLYQGNLNHSIMLTPDARIETTKYYRQGGQTSNVDDSSRTRFAKKKSYKSNKNKSTKTGHFAQKKRCPDCFTSRNFPTASNNRSTPQNVLIIRALSKDHPNTTFL